MIDENSISTNIITTKNIITTLNILLELFIFVSKVLIEYFKKKLEYN